VVRTLSTTSTASRGGSAPPASQWSAAAAAGCGRGIEGLPLLVRGAAHHGRCVFAVGEEARSDGLAVHPVAEAVVPPRGGGGGTKEMRIAQLER
jgi:hypothetical protein